MSRPSPLVRRASGAPVRTALAAALGAAILAGPSPAPAQQAAIQSASQARVNRANWILAERFGSTAMRQAVYSTGVEPHWFGKSDSLWYNWRDRNGSRFYLVVPDARLKRPLFDHVKLAAALATAQRKGYEPNNLPFRTLTLTRDHRAIRFTVDSTRYEWMLGGETLRAVGKFPRDSVLPDEEREERGGVGGGGGGGGGQGQQGGDFRAFSPDSSAFVFARDHNLFLVERGRTDTVQLTTDGAKSYSFGFRDTTFSQLQQQQQQDDDQRDDAQRRQERNRDPRVRPQVVWSPDSKAFAVMRNDARKVRELYLVNALSEPRPTMSAYSYAMPGEENVAQAELYVHRRGERGLTRLNVARWRDQRLLYLHFPVGADRLRLVRRDRLQRNLELIEVDVATRAVRPLIAESVENAYLESQMPRYVKPGGDLVWWSERSGFGHLYLYSHDGAYKRPLTSGSWRVEGVAAVDSIRGVVWLDGVGRDERENPYYTHLYRVNGDGSGFALVNAGHANHATMLSPTKRYVVDTYSRVDAVPKSVLRDATGRVVLDLEEMDVSRLRELGWKMPSTFVVKAADGITDIYGNMWKPFDFDSTKRYPIVAHVYPGPQTEQVAPGFMASGTQQQLAQLGFIVIQIGNRGGSPQRSNAYHSYGYFNLRDYALADKKAGIEQLAARYPWIDIERVGIYGHSGGGFLSAAALLQPPYNDFFKVGVASAGNHDNNIYNQNWSEQHHGLRVRQRADSAAAARRRATISSSPTAGDGGGGGGALAAATAARADTVVDDSLGFEIRVPTNADLAPNLKGRLLLTHGDMDNNVHPGNTIRLVNALIKANKRFDMLIMPGKPHGYGDMQAYHNRLMFEYFTEHLMGDYYRLGADIR